MKLDGEPRKTRAVSTLIVVGLAVALAGGCAGKYAGWAENHTGNVVVYTDAKVEHQYMQEWLERSFVAYRAFFPDIDPGKVDAVWLKTEPGWFKRFFAPWDDPPSAWTLENLPSASRIGKGGLIVLERREEMYLSGDSFGMSSIRDHNLAKLQMAHLFVKHAVPMAPLWLQIGLGRYLSKYRVNYRGKLYRACFGSYWFDEPIQVNAGSGDSGQFDGGGRRVLIGVHDLLTADWYRYDGKLRYWYEFTAYALVHYLIHGEQNFNVTRFGSFLRALRAGKTTEEALALAYPHVLPQEWDDKLGGHVRPAHRAPSRDVRLATPLCFRIRPEVPFDFKPKRRKADPREIATMLEDLERVEPFRRHSGWMPTDVIAAEAAKRPRKGPAGERGGAERGQGRAADKRPASSAAPRSPAPPADEGATPTLRDGVPPPPPPPSP